MACYYVIASIVTFLLFYYTSYDNSSVVLNKRVKVYVVVLYSKAYCLHSSLSSFNLYIIIRVGVGFLWSVGDELRL